MVYSYGECFTFLVCVCVSRGFAEATKMIAWLTGKEEILDLEDFERV